jgi:hypothetical protein
MGYRQCAQCSNMTPRDYTTRGLHREAPSLKTSTTRRVAALVTSRCGQIMMMMMMDTRARQGKGCMCVGFTKWRRLCVQSSWLFQIDTEPSGRTRDLSSRNWARNSMMPWLMASRSLTLRFRKSVSRSRSPLMYFCFCSPSKLPYSVSTVTICESANNAVSAFTVRPEPSRSGHLDRVKGGIRTGDLHRLKVLELARVTSGTFSSHLLVRAQCILHVNIVAVCQRSDPSMHGFPVQGVEPEGTEVSKGRLVGHREIWRQLIGRLIGSSISLVHSQSLFRKGVSELRYLAGKLRRRLLFFSGTLHQRRCHS